ncbi:preprotein translocase subunit SecE [Enterovirga sp.]|jgi:preprotein translocase subunit SecE|uniref:preprotein translocase subunit SecE n=1 Tax=Enterovirga sp. TaxID=2026350 RepID=UPI00260A7CFA|nr:preprotein translocase subunit SecE [Enterovirga sp.]MDB5591189.1 preprotein translocase, SecE subunit [Enterovirga sp.]
MAKLQTTSPAVTPKKRPRVGPLEFLSQVRAEGEKVTWPTRKETLITTAMVFVMVVAASVFFVAADFIMQKAVGLVLGLGG